MTDPKFKVGQRWRTLGGWERTVVELQDPLDNRHSLITKGQAGYTYAYTIDGLYVGPDHPNDHDLVELIDDGKSFKVGQTWRTRTGELRRICYIDTDGYKYPVISEGRDGDQITHTLAGGFFEDEPNSLDLIELVEDLSMEKKESKFKVGQEWKTRLGWWRRVINVDDPPKGGHPVTVESSNGHVYNHTLDGYYVNASHQSDLDLTTLIEPVEEEDMKPQETKPSGSGTKFDHDKPDLSLLPSAFKDEVAWCMMDGASKYGRWNYLKGMDITRLLAAAERHLDAIKRGEWMVGDSVSKKATHAGAVAANMLMLLHLRSVGALDESNLQPTTEKP
jgi:hypothetical protein